MVAPTATAPNSRLALQSQTSPDQIDWESEQFIVIDFRNEWDFISVLREILPNTPSVVATALQPAIAS